MNFIEIKKERRGILAASSIICRSSQRGLSELRFEYRRQRLIAYDGESVQVETDGKKYINFVLYGTTFRRIKSHFLETALCAEGDCIIFRWKMKNTRAIGSNYIAQASFGGFQYSMSEMPRCSGVRLECKAEGDRMLNLGIAAYYWTLIENSNNLA
jgi:hypothetical protein